MITRFSSLLNWKISLPVLGIVLAIAPPAFAARLNLSVTNLDTQGGRVVTSPWAGFHDGNFDLFNVGDPLRPSLRPVMQDARITPLSNTFRQSPGAVAGTPPPATPPAERVLQPNETFNQVFELPDMDTMEAENIVFSYVLPIVTNGPDGMEATGNFIANEDPMAFPVFNGTGEFIPVDQIITTGQIIRADGPDMIAVPAFADGDQPVLRIQITQVEEDPQAVPEPSLLIGMGIVSLAGAGYAKAKKKSLSSR